MFHQFRLRQEIVGGDLGAQEQRGANVFGFSNHDDRTVAHCGADELRLRFHFNL